MAPVVTYSHGITKSGQEPTFPWTKWQTSVEYAPVTSQERKDALGALGGVGSRVERRSWLLARGVGQKRGISGRQGRGGCGGIAPSATRPFLRGRGSLLALPIGWAGASL